jgi:integrase/recombinase XerD
MSALRQAVADYLAIRRAVGYKLKQEGRMLAGFIDYLEERDATRVTIDAALAWATEPSDASPNWWAQRLTVVRGFARYLKTLDADTEVPPTDLLARRADRSMPYLCSPAQLAALIEAARRLASPLRAATFETLIGLMAITGLRPGEAMRLDRDDVDLTAGLLIVRHSKLGKSRQVPLHPTTTDALSRYARRRDQLCPQPKAASFFLSGAGTRLNHTNTSRTFAGLLAAARVVAPPGHRRPRLGDLRHRFAVDTLVTWHTDGVDVPARLPILSTYLGHANPASTYWYLQASPQLMAAAAGRLEQLWQDPS